MIPYETRILREIAVPDSQEGLRWGAAMSEALSYLQGNGYVTRGTRPQVTEKGRAWLSENPEAGA